MLASGINILFEGQNMARLMSGLAVTIKIALIAVVLSLIFGVIFGIIMTSKNLIVKAVCRFYLEAIRIIPILVWLFLFYFGLTRAMGIHLEGEFISIVVFTMWGTAEMGDIVRGAVTSMPKHQTESGLSLGLTKLQIYRYILVPQTVRRVLPGAINLATRMVKTTSLVVIIGVVEVLKVGQQIIEGGILNTLAAPLWVYGFIFFLYFILCYPISIVAKRLEAKWQS